MPSFTRALAFAIIVASLGVPNPSAISAEPLIQQLCDILQHPDAQITQEELKRRLEDEFEDDFITHIESLAEGDLTHLTFNLGQLPGSPWTDLIPEKTTPEQQQFFESVQELIDSGTIPDHIEEANLTGESPDRTNALRRAINLSVEVLLGKRKPENAKEILAKLVRGLPSERIQEAHGHTEKIDRENLFLSRNPQGRDFNLLDPKTKEVRPTRFQDTVQYTGANERVERIELVDRFGRVIYEAPTKKIKNKTTSLDEKWVTLPVVPDAKIRVTLKDGSTFDQAYFDFSPTSPVRPLPTQRAIAKNLLSGGHITSDIENFIATYSDLLEFVNASTPQVFRVVGTSRQEFTLRQYEFSFKGASPGTKPIIKTTFDTPEIAAAVEKFAVDRLKRRHIAKDQGLPSRTVHLKISLPPDPRPDGSIPPWTNETGRTAYLPYELYMKSPGTLNRSSTSYPKPIVHKRPYQKKQKAP